jgi:hypothetical protein
VAQTADIERVILFVEIALTIGKNIVLVVSAIVAVTIALALYTILQQATLDGAQSINYSQVQ